MDLKFVPVQFCSAIIAVVFVLATVPLQVRAQAVSLDAAKMPRIGTVDERFASYNIEMAEVTGGKPGRTASVISESSRPELS